MKNVLLFLTIVAMLFVSGCATIFTGTKDSIRFDSDPQGAKVFIDGIEICKTPCTVPVKRSLSDKLAEIKLDGYETRVITLDRDFNAVSIINLGNILFWGIDAATGALMKYDRKAYDIELEKDVRASLSNPSRIEINTSENVVDVYVRGE